MSQHRTVVLHKSTGQPLQSAEVLIGFDLPCGGYFCSIFRNGKDTAKEEDMIGFGIGVSLNELLEWCQAKHVMISDELKQKLVNDEKTAEPLSPLQLEVIRWLKGDKP